ncbi:hypothetical protein BT69DRAFT_1278893 [Atractiella rhizophila]|nr:hypothetical protein BT69DRAFT_1278893 [Atractiella rhizophila]
MVKRKNAAAPSPPPAAQEKTGVEASTSESTPTAAASNLQEKESTFISYMILTAIHLNFLAFTHNALQSSLAPIYGGIPSHQSAFPPLFLSFFLCHLAGLWLRSPKQNGRITITRNENRSLVVKTAGSFMAVWAILAPLFLNGLANFAQYLGPYVGPTLERLIIEGPLIAAGGIVSQLYAHYDYYQNPEFKKLQMYFYAAFEPFFMTTVVVGYQDRVFSYFPGMVQINQVHIWRAAAIIPYLIVPLAHRFLSSSQQPASSPKLKRANRHLLVLPWAILALTFTHPIYSNSHHPADYPYRAHSRNLRILHREKSVTGWISVGESPVPGTSGEGKEARYLRADHSLLGGLWVGVERARLGYYAAADEETREEIDEKAVLTAESIYTTFLLQEAVRLVERSSKEGRERGLVIWWICLMACGGLGTGISARSLQALGVNTTIVELDPSLLWRRRAGGWCLYSGCQEYLEGLTKYRRWKERKFDYIIHDVFTGGMVPAKLFTMEFFKLVKEVLAVHGVIAVNFAGEIKAEPSQIVLQTLLRSFRGNCRAFEDGFQAHDEKQDSDEFKNMVVFCINTPIEYGRRVLTSFKQNEMDLNSMIDWKKPMMSTDKLASKLDKVQSKGAYKHWPIMRGVFPDEIWRWY